MLLYLDGQLVNTRMYGKQIRQSRMPLRFGWTYEEKPVCGYFNGWIDEVRIWNCVRSEKQLRVMMKKTLTGKEPNLVGYWTFDDATAEDLTANQTHGKLKVGTYQPVKSVRHHRTVMSGGQQQTWHPYDLGGLSTIDGQQVSIGKVYLSGIPPYEVVMQWVKEGKTCTIVNCLVPWEMSLQYNWAKDEGCNVFHFPFGWAKTPEQWHRQWGRDKKQAILLLLREYYQPIQRIFALLAEDKYLPVLYHCNAGRGRSRIIAALIYLALGVPKDDILRVSPRDWVIHLVFQEVKRCGGIESYLKGIGVTEEQIKAVRRNLLE